MHGGTVLAAVVARCHSSGELAVRPGEPTFGVIENVQVSQRARLQGRRIAGEQAEVLGIDAFWLDEGIGMHRGEILLRQCLYPRLPSQGVVDKVVRQHSIGLQRSRGYLPARIGHTGGALGCGVGCGILARKHAQAVDHAQLESQKCHELGQADHIRSGPSCGIEVPDRLRGGILGVEGQKVRPIEGGS